MVYLPSGFHSHADHCKMASDSEISTPALDQKMYGRCSQMGFPGISAIGMWFEPSYFPTRPTLLSVKIIKKTKYHHPNGRKKTSKPDVCGSFLPPDISSIRVPRQVSVFGACNLGSQVSLRQKPEGPSGASKRNRKSRENSYGEGSVHLLMLPWFCEQRSIHQLYVGYLGGQTTHSHISDIYGYLISDISS